MQGRFQRPQSKHTRSRRLGRLTRPIAAGCVVLVAIADAHAAPTLRQVEASMEHALVSYVVRESGHGHATIHECPRCTQSLRFVINPDTRLFHGDREVPFRRAPTLRRLRVTLFHLPDTNVITRIIIQDSPWREAAGTESP